jgi:RNA polymerase sigma-70 factor, ECF subfamily
MPRIPSAPHGATHSSITEPTTLAQLMQRYVGGDARAYALLYRRLARRVRAHIVSRIGACSEVDDLVQATFMRAHAARHQYRAQPGALDDAPAAWFCAIARNTAINHVRSRHRDPLRVGVVEPIAIEQTPAALGDPAEVVEATSIHLARRRALHFAIQRLPAGQREVVRLCGLGGLPATKVARRLGLRDVAVRVRTHRAIKNLREWMGTNEGAHAA